MRRGTTPTITARINADVTDLDLHLAFRQSSYAPIVKSGGDIEVTLDGDETVITTTLTQADTLTLHAGAPVEVQVRGYRDGGAVAVATTIGTLEVKRILEEGVLDD